MQDFGIVLWGDVEFVWCVCDKVVWVDGILVDWVFIIGMNGKMMMIQLIVIFFVEGGLCVVLCGNIGVLVFDVVCDFEGFDVFVVELFSYQFWYFGLLQLEGEFFLYLVVCLNLVDDYFVWYGSVQVYCDVKVLVYWNICVVCVYNKFDEVIRWMVEEVEVVEGVCVIGFDFGIFGLSDIGVVEGLIVDCVFLDDCVWSVFEFMIVVDFDVVGFVVLYIVQNIFVVSVFVCLFGVELEVIYIVLQFFYLDVYCIEIVVRYVGIIWVDDFKVMNLYVVVLLLCVYFGVVWVVGGDLKGVDIVELVVDVGCIVCVVVVIGVECVVVVMVFW